MADLNLSLSEGNAPFVQTERLLENPSRFLPLMSLQEESNMFIQLRELLSHLSSSS